MKPLALYLHIPFCGHICPFCAFAVRKDDPKKHQAYLQALKLEVEILKSQFELDLTSLKSVYLGGGTPSRLHISEMEGLVTWLNSLGNFTAHSFSIEMNPEDVTLDYAHAVKDLGINRVSLGVQSFNDKQLQLMERKHSAKDNHKALEILAQAGFTNINLDLLCGLPNQTLKEVKKDLETFNSYHPQHLSFYLLTMEERAKAGKKKDWVNWAKNQENLLTDIYLSGVEYLNAVGLQQYEVSNFARPGFESLQNISNWAGEDYLGLGQGAHSMVHIKDAHSKAIGRRFGNESSWAKYQQKLTKGELPWVYCDKLTDLEKAEEKLMIDLRSPKGILKSQLLHWKDAGFFDLSQASWEQLIFEGMAMENPEESVSLTPKGLLLADEITAWLLSR
ncbi:MAG: radical SAM family heme chaperone HemW [SAR324 cluster bacterium]|nr:radical SAM family heme chaperone HemW [SAR324 cluster bacterium]